MKKTLQFISFGLFFAGILNAQVGVFDSTFNQGQFAQTGTSSNYLRVISTGNETCIITANEGYFSPAPVTSQFTDAFLNSLSNTPGNNITATSIGIYTSTNQFDEFTDVYKDTNGKIYAVGYEKDSYMSSNNPRFFAIRYSAEGTIDATFNGGQPFYIEASSYYYGERVRPLSDGKILIAGHNLNYSLFFFRFKQNGTPDSTFGVNGLYNFNMIDGSPQYITDMVVLSNGKILIAGRAKDLNNNNGFEVGFVARLNSDGSLDNTFGVNAGYTTINFGDDDNLSAVNSITLTSSGDIIAAGAGTITVTDGSGSYQTSNAGLAKLDANGQFITTFASNGIYKGNTLGYRSEFTKVRILSNGDIIAGGRIAPTNNLDSLAFVFFTSNGAVNTNYSADGIVYFYLPNVIQYQSIKDFDIQPDGKVIFVASSFVPVTRPCFIGRMLMNEQPVAGIDESSLSELTLYPNPTTDFIQLNNTQPMQIQILDISGKVVMQSLIQPNARISVEALSNGMYFISTENGASLKFIKN
ncbi:MAG: T9SS type A sorting domain-containing protein [Flavobacteriales bacterium]|nr:T9SS type A sorting domain-containing protein [Flavobacteriales bacterium]